MKFIIVIFTIAWAAICLLCLANLKIGYPELTRTPTALLTWVTRFDLLKTPGILVR